MAASASARSSLFWALVSLTLASVALFFASELQTLLGRGEFTLLGRQLSLTEPKALVALSLIPLLLFGVGRSLADLPWQQRLLSFIFRAAFFCALILGLGRPQESEKVTRLCTVALVDVSSSIADADLEKVGERLQSLSVSRGKDDEFRALVFGDGARELRLSREDGGQALSASDLRAGVGAGATNLQEAMEMARAYVRSDCVSRYVVFTDGIETRGDALSVLGELKQSGVRVFTSAVSEVPAVDAAIVGLEIPSGVRVGEPFSVRVALVATKEMKGQLRLYQGSTLNGLGGAREIDVPKGDSVFSFDSVVRVPGEVNYRAEFIPAGDDHFKENNSFESSLEVPGPPRVLLVDRNPGQASYLAQALVAQQLDVDVRAPGALPQSSGEWAQFHFAILSDLAYADVSRGAEQLLMQYVRSGGGLLFAGGEAGFGPGGWDRSQLKKILPVTMNSRKEREIPGVAMALVIDRSGSMNGLPIEMAKEACIATLGVLEKNDLIEVIAFDSRPQRYVKMQPARYQSRIRSSVARIVPGGGTEIFNSLDMAYQDLSSVEARKKHIILLTDGNASSDGLYELAGAAFAEGISITAVGLGGGVNHSLLTMIAETGGGRFHAAEDPSRLPRIFTRETEMISKKASLDDWFPVSVAHRAQFLEGVGIGAAPYLRGYTSTSLAPAPSQAVLLSDRGEPILARRPVGLGWTLAWTSDLKARWATDWLKWGRFSRLMAQLVREHQRSDDKVILPMEVSTVGDRVIASVEAFDENEDFDSGLESVLELRLMAKEEVQAETLPFRRVAPGLYQASTELARFGTYSLTAKHQRRTVDGELRAVAASFGSVSRPYPEEYRDLNPRPGALAAWAQASGGIFEPKDSQVWDARGDSVQANKGRQNELIWLALLLFLVDLLLRRVRIFDRSFARAS